MFANHGALWCYIILEICLINAGVGELSWRFWRPNVSKRKLWASVAFSALFKSRFLHEKWFHKPLMTPKWLINQHYGILAPVNLCSIIKQDWKWFKCMTASHNNKNRKWCTFKKISDISQFYLWICMKSHVF